VTDQPITGENPEALQSLPAGGPILPARNSTIHSIFIGPNGLRAGWRFLLYIAMVATILFVILPAMKLLEPRIGKLWEMLAVEAVLFAAVVVPALVMTRIEKRRFCLYGLPRAAAFGKLFWIGGLWGIVSLTALMVCLRGAHVFYFGTLALHGTRIMKFAAFWALFFVLVGFFEEFLLRGYTQFTLTTGIGFWPAAILLSAAFGAIHLGNQGEAWIGALAAAIIGLFFCLTLRRTGNLWFAVGFHASWDWGETYLYSVPNSGTVMPGHLLSSSFHGSPWLSGGSVGPEGSVLVFVVIAMMWLRFNRRYPEANYPAQHSPAPLLTTNNAPCT
jgi:membrane protease YdiL (CAAX protease family)